MNTNTIAVIGGTGKSGKFLVQSLLNKQYPIRMLLRNPENFTLKSPLINIVKGDVRNSEAVHHLIKDCDVVISTLGQSVGEKSIFSDATSNIIKAMNSYGIKRYIVTTGLNVNTPFDHKNEKVKMATDWMYQNYPETTTDKQKEYELLNESNLNWTLVRLPLINLTDEGFAKKNIFKNGKGKTFPAQVLQNF
ncbi:NAD(P)-dependent oxidoreductase [Chryseobacterium sp. VD8]|uniref:NAD(P)-dependent oxidoreductase n=1 Tax=Chryseobacterium sp. VD8 TaxID=3081254 RepID=UPI00301A78C8